MDEQSDIVELIRKNRTKGAIRLVAEYKDRLYSVALAMCDDAVAAEDFVMCTFESAIDKIDSCSKPESFFAWMCSIMRNLHRNSMRGKIAKNTILAGGLNDLDAITPPQMASDSRTTVDCGIVREMVDSLPPKLKEAIVLRYFMEMPLLQIAKFLAIPLGTVQSRLDTARKALAMRFSGRSRAPLAALLVAGALVAMAIPAFILSLDSRQGHNVAAEKVPAEICDEGANGISALANGGTCADCASRTVASGKDAPTTLNGETTNEETTNGETEMKETKMGIKAVTAAIALAAALPGQAASEDAYIENSNGDQYFNTGHYIGPNTKLEIDFQLLEIKPQVRLFGVSGAEDADHPYCNVYLGEPTPGDDSVWSYFASKSDYSAQRWNSEAVADLERHRIVFDFNSAKFEVWTADEKVVDKSMEPVSPGTQARPLGLFAKCAHESGLWSPRFTPSGETAPGTFTNPAKMRLYSFRIYESGALVKEFLPWVKGGVAGLKETVSGQFHAGENARACVAGGNITVEKDDPYVSMPGNDVSQAAVAGKTQYFETGYTFTPNSRLELDYALLTPDWTTNTSWTYESAVFWAANGSSRVHLLPRGNSGGNYYGCYYWQVGGIGGNVAYAGVDYAYNVRRKVSVSADSIMMETAGFTNFSITSSSPVTANLDGNALQLGHRPGSYPGVPMKIYGLKIYETADGVETLVRDYRPCFSGISNSVPKLVDAFNAENKSIPTVYDNNCTNIVFDAGGDIQGDAAASDAYLDFDGVNGHCIDTEYVLTKNSRLEADFAIWNNNFEISGGEPPYFFEQRGYNSDDAQCNGIWFLLYHANNGCYGWQYHDYERNTAWTDVPVGNERVKFTFDAPSNHATAYRGGELAWDREDMAYHGTLTATNCTETLHIGGNWQGVSNAGAMRLYSVKIYESGELVRYFVPCVVGGEAGLYETCEKRFFPLTGGKVSGATTGGVEFQIAPKENAIVSKRMMSGRPTLVCMASGAQSYEWYEDGVLVEGETSNEISIPWRRASSPLTYSVKPVYTVFNETVKGAEAFSEVKMSTLGLIVIVD